MNAKSHNGVSIRLPEERWAHIITEHAELAQMQDELLEAIADPERILEGNAGELMALREVETGKWLVVIYREFEEDGFIITAFLTRRGRSLEKRKIVWRS